MKIFFKFFLGNNQTEKQQCEFWLRQAHGGIPPAKNILPKIPNLHPKQPIQTCCFSHLQGIGIWLLLQYDSQTKMHSPFRVHLLQNS